MSVKIIRRTTGAATLLLMGALSAVRAHAETRSPDQLLACMEQNTAQRGPEGNQAFLSERVYTAANALFHRSGTLTAEVAYQPGEKSFRILSRAGSGVIQKRVLEPLLAVEVENARLSARLQTDIHRRNYELEFVEVDADNSAFVYQLQPKTNNRLLFKGKIWLDPETCGVRRVAGEPAVSPSFWVKKTAFVHEFARFGDIWLPAHHRSEVQLRMFGDSTLEIDYRNYSWPGNPVARNAPTGLQ